MCLINMFCDFFPECSHYHETSPDGGERGRSLTTLVANFRNLEHMIPAQPQYNMAQTAPQKQYWEEKGSSELGRWSLDVLHS